MFTVAELFRPQGLVLEDHEGYFNITQYLPKSKAVVWFLSIPKDGVSDSWRLKEAVERKTKGGKGLVMIPYLELDNMDSPTYARFKQEWDRELICETTELWGGSYVTHAPEHKNNGKFVELDLTCVPHYYNILLTVEEQLEFEAVNPGLTYVECDCACMRGPHYHGVHGLYAGAVLDPSGNARDVSEEFPELEVRYTAPPLTVIDDWLYLPVFEGKHKVPMEDKLEIEPGKKAKKKARKNRTTKKSDKSACSTPGPESDGARALRLLISDSPVWGDLLATYRNPRSARWASPGMICASETRERELRRQWNAEYRSKVLPLVQGDGIPVVRLLTKIRDLDDHMWKLKASYFLRRLTAGDSGVIGYGSGKFVRLPAQD